MSLFDYLESQRIAAQDYSFYGLLMAAIRKADTHNLGLIRQVFPRVVEELELRYSARYGKIAGDA